MKAETNWAVFECINRLTNPILKFNWCQLTPPPFLYAGPPLRSTASPICCKCDFPSGAIQWFAMCLGKRYPKHVDHIGASIPNNRKRVVKEDVKWRESSNENLNVIEGAIVVGPNEHDEFHDVCTYSKYTESTLTGNSSLVAALVALSGEKHVWQKNIFSALPPLFMDATLSPAPWTPERML